MCFVSIASATNADPSDILADPVRRSIYVYGTAILVTRSADGMTLLRSGEQPFHVPAFAKEVYDVTGAGDTVVATVALALAAGARLEPAIELASVAAAVSMSTRGTSTITAGELHAALEHGRS